ncbi:helix-turn-helix domain-containing protein [Allosphingosinicella deserti]|nr:helix-turn-helix transcriptional regulator [Sphingomonas deserti]
MTLLAGRLSTSNNGMHDDFAEKLRLALDALSMSRGRFAAELGVDKSLVGRWASGAVIPSAANRERITHLLASKRPGFSLLDWKREISDFAMLFGASAQKVVERADDPFHASLLQIVQPSIDANVGAYEGFWRTTHASLFEQGRFCQQYGIIRRASSGVLDFEGGADGIRYRGAMFPVAGQLFCIGGENVRHLPSFMIFNVMAVPKISFMDGLVLTANSPLRIPTAYPVICERIADLSGDRARDEAYMAELMRRPEAMEDSSLLPPVMREHLLRGVDSDTAKGIGGMMLTASLSPQLGEIIALSQRQI